MLFLSPVYSLLVAGIGSVSAVCTDSENPSPDPVFRNGKYIVESGAGEYKFFSHWSFKSDQGRLPAGLHANSDKIGEPPHVHWFKHENVVVKDGFMMLTVPGGQGDGPILSAEVQTDVGNILYGSVRTRAILSKTPGVCNAAFFYRNDHQETDIEYLSDPKSQSNPNGIPQIWFTNQDADHNGKATDTHITPPADATSVEHEYRIDWTKRRVAFFIDGHKKWETTKDVPTRPGYWVWNNWSNGDKGWSAGPPEKDAVFKISDIKMYYNTTRD